MRSTRPIVNQSTRPESRIRGTSYEYVIVGGGIAGLSMAALLAKEGFSVLVLEAIHYPGGCASSYHAHGAWFDVGATTMSGTDRHQPLAALFAEIGEFPDRLEVDPGLAVSLHGRSLRLSRDRSRWMERMEDFFEEDSRAFWREIFSLNDIVYRMLDRVPFIPPHTIAEAIRDLPGIAPEAFRFAMKAFDSVEDRMERHQLRDPRFRSLVDNQLMITNQVTAEDAPLLAGALGLSYANSTISSVKGGMITFARFLESRARSFGAKVVYLQRVERISSIGRRWRVETKSGNEVFAENVITQTPLETLASVTGLKVRAYYERLLSRIESKGVKPWGAITLYGLADEATVRDVPPNLQIIPRLPLKLTDSSSVFLSLGHPLDFERAPSGTRTMTVSTHIDPAYFNRFVNATNYADYKEAVNNEIVGVIRSSLPELSNLRLEFSQVGTPRTFRKYTGRPGGFVGGLPLSKKIFPFSYPRTMTPFPGLYNLGDNFFPGQGLPGVVLGALALHRRIKERIGNS